MDIKEIIEKEDLIIPIKNLLKLVKNNLNYAYSYPIDNKSFSNDIALIYITKANKQMCFVEELYYTNYKILCNSCLEDIFISFDNVVDYFFPDFIENHPADTTYLEKFNKSIDDYCN